ncbi:MAG: hypothetical protein KZQ98_20040 [Candidatus Thiodiazotropha sp. (ex Lucinoma borealis)]|nr:hypothetical protein [Candidatus Thiodiazotropha sp. (ex Lucinoma borealis)]
MEIVLAVLLLFGGFTLGSITADKGDDEPQSAMANGDGVPDSRQHAQTMLQSDPTRCHSDRAVIYRDLTVPYHGQIERPAMEIGDCEGECPDE